jgi:RimJ/RimL family protein N-acetyltransferase
VKGNSHKFSNDEIKFRTVVMDDAQILLEWRNDPLTRKFSKNGQKISMKEHVKWLRTSLSNSKRKIFIVQYNGVPVGTIRTDEIERVTELSWTVAPEARGQGIGKRMVAIFVKRIKGPVKAEVKANNEASKHIAEHAGMKFYNEENGIFYYRKTAARIFN